MSNTEEVLPDNWLKTEKKFTHACSQIMVLSRHLHDIRTRHERATRGRQAAQCQTLEMKLNVMEGVRSMYYEYTDRKMDELADIEKEITQQILRDTLRESQ